MLFLRISFFSLGIFILSFSSNLFSFPFVPNIYISGGFLKSDSNFTATKESLQNISKKNKGVVLALGIRPIKLPILSGFRIEGQYSKASSANGKDISYGLVTYYDLLTFIPYIDIYVGAGLHGSENDIKGIKVAVENKNTSELKNNKTKVSLHGGVNVKLPVLNSLSIFVEYRQFNDSLGDFIKSSVKKSSSGGFSLTKKDIVVGMRYYILG